MRRDGDCSGDSFLPQRCGTTADRCTGGSAGQRASFGASGADAGASLGQCLGGIRGIGAKRAGECFVGERHGVQRGVEFAARFKKVQVGRPCERAHDRSGEVRREGGNPEGLVGHVTQASARAKGESESSLGIVFDKAILKNGQEIPLNAGIQAIASAQSSVSAAGADLDTIGGGGASAGGSAAGGGSGALGGVTSAAGGAVGAVTNTAANVGGVAGGTVNSATNAGGSISGASKGAVGGLNAAGQLTSNSQGVFGLNGLNLSAAASNATQGSVITSAGKSVHLDSGTRMLLVSQAQAGEQGASKQPAASKPEPKSEPKSEPNKPSKQ